MYSYKHCLLLLYLYLFVKEARTDSHQNETDFNAEYGKDVPETIYRPSGTFENREDFLDDNAMVKIQGEIDSQTARFTGKCTATGGKFISLAWYQLKFGQQILLNVTYDANTIFLYKIIEKSDQSTILFCEGLQDREGLPIKDKYDVPIDASFREPPVLEVSSESPIFFNENDDVNLECRTPYIYYGQQINWYKIKEGSEQFINSGTEITLKLSNEDDGLKVFCRLEYDQNSPIKENRVSKEINFILHDTEETKFDSRTTIIISCIVVVIGVVAILLLLYIAHRRRRAKRVYNTALTYAELDLQQPKTTLELNERKAEEYVKIIGTMQPKTSVEITST